MINMGIVTLFRYDLEESQSFANLRKGRFEMVTLPPWTSELRGGDIVMIHPYNLNVWKMILCDNREHVTIILDSYVII